MKKKLLSALLAGLLVFSAVPCTVSAAGWYSASMSSDDTVLTVTVSLGADANWQLVRDGGNCVETLTYEISDGIFTGSYISNGEDFGSDSMELIFMVDGISYGSCRVNLWVSENGQMEVTGGYANIDDYNGGGSSDNPTAGNDDDAGAYPGVSQYSNYVQYYVTADGLTLRKDNSSASLAVDSYAYGTQINVGEIIDGWAVVVDGYGKRIGYVYASYLSEEKPGQSKSSDSSSDTQQVQAQTFYVTAEGGLTIRRTPGVSGEAFDTFAYGTAVHVIAIEDGWATLVDPGNSQWSGYCSAKYLSSTNPAGTTAASDEAEKEEKPWFELSASGQTLTLRLPEEEDAVWEYEISDPSAFELLTEESTTEDDEKIWAASFIGTGKKSGNVELVLKRVLPDQSIDQYRSMEIAVSEDAVMRVISARDSWFETDENGILTLMLPINQAQGYDWYDRITDEEIAELINSTLIETEEEVELADGTLIDGYWNASYRGLKEGETEMTLTYRATDVPEIVRTLTLSVDSEAKIRITDVEETDDPEELVETEEPEEVQ